jgi:glutaredoxin
MLSCKRVGFFVMLVCVLTSSTLACKKTAQPPLVVRDDTPNLLFTWIDERGDYHVEQAASDVPAAGAVRESVRIVDPTRDEGSHDDSVFIANLSSKQADGAYPLRTTTLREFEKIAEDRRRSVRGNPVGLADHANSAKGVGGGSAERGLQERPPGEVGQQGAAVMVIIYGASWCGPCHDAERFFKKRGIPYVMKDVEQDPNAAAEMRRKLSASGRSAGSIPVLDVGGKVLVGFSESSLMDALGKGM